ncbi:DNA mismatch endonuclease Vsr, partial [Candidatus Peregrinibacteria bacterium]|nr:DNA mismatch endonuclease Vsr [Candidatus Peregrinibacteria bacterium]
MADKFDRKTRSKIMSRIRAKNTSLEVNFRKLLWQEGLRGYRIHYKLPGKPDIVFTKKKIAIFVDGCFWHKCPKCYEAPKTNKKYWLPKIEKNASRDKENARKLRSRGFKVIRIWEHEVLQNPEKC